MADTGQSEAAVHRPAVQQDDQVAAPSADQRDATAVSAGRYDILTGQRLESFDSPQARAYAAVDRETGRHGLVALIGLGRLPPRRAMLDKLARFELPDSVRVHDTLSMHWPATTGAGSSASVHVTVVARPPGERVMRSPKDRITPWSTRALMEGLLNPAARALLALASHGLTSRAVRPTNLWRVGDSDAIIIGEAVSAPPAMDQPAAFEPVESMMADPVGRGEGASADDMYALGVCLLTLATGRWPRTDLDDAALLREKLARGSYATLVGDHSLPRDVTEVLRGLLADDAQARWSADRLAAWLAGQRLGYSQAAPERQAARLFEWRGAHHGTLRSVAHHLSTDWQDAPELLSDGKLDIWIRRSVARPDRADALLVSADAPQSTTLSDDHKVARAVAALDPAAPLRFQGLAFFPDAVGAMLASSMGDEARVRSLISLLTSMTPQFWARMQASLRPADDAEATNRTFDTLRAYLRSPATGRGVERCIYEADSAMPCLSRTLENELVSDADALLPALNRAAEAADRQRLPIDRHVAAFIAARCGRTLETPLERIRSAGEAAGSARACLHVLAEMQKRYRHGPLPALASWMGELLQPVLLTFRHAKVRKGLEREVEEAVATGSLTEMRRVLEDPAARQADDAGFAAARKRYRVLATEVHRLETNPAWRNARVRALGNQLALSLAGAISAGVIAVVVTG